MRPYAISVLLLFVSSVGISQSRKVPLDKSFIENTIEYYYSAKARQHNISKFYIARDSVTKDAKTDYALFKVQFLTPEEAPEKLPQIKDQPAKLDRLMIKWITFDTIDVVITGCTVGERKLGKKVSGQQESKTQKFLTDCTETFVDVPTCRFVYDRNTMKWGQINRGKDVKPQGR